MGFLSDIGKGLSSALSGGSLFTGLVPGIIGAFGQSSTNRANSAQAQRQMDFQERMSNTAHQREVADLRAAGLNPILSAGGSGASSPSGSQATMLNSAKAGLDARREAEALYASVKLMGQQASTEMDKQDNLIADTNLKKTQQDQVKQMVEQVKEQTRLLKNNATIAGQEAGLNEDLGDLPAGKLLQAIKMILK